MQPVACQMLRTSACTPLSPAGLAPLLAFWPYKCVSVRLELSHAPPCFHPLRDTTYSNMNKHELRQDLRCMFETRLLQNTANISHHALPVSGLPLTILDWTSGASRLDRHHLHRNPDCCFQTPPGSGPSASGATSTFPWTLSLSKWQPHPSTHLDGHHELARQLLQLPLAQLVRVHRDAALSERLIL